MYHDETAACPGRHKDPTANKSKQEHRQIIAYLLCRAKQKSIIVHFGMYNVIQ